MKPDNLREWIVSLTDDIEFEYLDIFGSICPFSKNNISVTYNGITKDYDNIDEVMTDKFFNGKSLIEISELLIF
ncbi:hypothetical protein Ana3638_11870 [Anaerocolumna sedimenticola]|uniref:Uncharacterized protein n=1 Tax=Anaerocolumna sedimenticola TaxID=2696063 RepID=A0A6P1TLT1_9FIRM|nr:hypothetical protein [Anaerocolumna sedimenticola]QHQ61383.1 hypothetical protein Ana3638_11870 [Anaerocolumna sedimenticola]